MSDETAEFSDVQTRDMELARLSMLDAVILATNEREQLMTIVHAATDADAARIAVIATFGVSEEQAYAMLDLQVRRFAAQERQRLNGDRNRLRTELGVS